jgi:predicted Zn-dependent protease
LVYSYAGGVGIRSGDPQDVGRLLLAGLYHQGQLDRKESRPLEAAAAFEEMARRFPDDPTIQLLGVESLLQDRKDPAGALKALDGVAVPAGDQRIALRVGLLRADALAQTGQTDSARTTLQALATAFPTNQRVKDQLAKLK